MKKYVYMFSEGNAEMRNLLGGKGAGLAEMTGLGLPVPQGFTITTEACTRYYDDGRQIGDDIMEQIKGGVAFTRDPATGEKRLMGEFLLNAQGEDVVAGIRTPQKIDRLKELMPEVYDQFTGICGEHGGDPSSIEFCDRIGLDYVSCSPFRVPIARLSAAQASIRAEEV